MENNQDLEDKSLDELRAEYDLRNLRVRKLGSELNNFANQKNLTICRQTK
jgi:hypothetical protein